MNSIKKSCSPDCAVVLHRQTEARLEPAVSRGMARLEDSAVPITRTGLHPAQLSLSPWLHGSRVRFLALALGTLLTTAPGRAAALDEKGTPPDPNRELRIAAVQAGRSHFAKGNPGLEANFAVLAAQARSAAAAGADLVLFPEYAITGWPYPKESVMNGLAEAVPGEGPWFRRYQALARELRTPLVGWLVETNAGRLFNCAFVLEADGAFVGKYRKVQANLGEQTWWGWSQGDSFQPIELRGVRYGLSICADMWYPETVRCGALLGADVVLHLSIADDMRHLVPARAFDNFVPIVMGIFQGGCYAVDGRGEWLGQLAPDQPGWKIFSVKPFARHWGVKYGGRWDERAGHFNLRNPAAYAPLVDPATRPPWTEIFFDSQGRPQTRDQLRKRFQGRYDAQDPEPAGK